MSGRGEQAGGTCGILIAHDGRLDAWLRLKLWPQHLATQGLYCTAAINSTAAGVGALHSNGHCRAERRLARCEHLMVQHPLVQQGDNAGTCMREY